MKTLIISLSFIILFTGCSSYQGKGRSIIKQEENYLQNAIEFNEFATFFLEQEKMKNIVIPFRGTSCEIVNTWSRCSNSETWKSTRSVHSSETVEELATIEEVLDVEGISEEVYRTVMTFLIKHSFSGVGKDNGSTMLEIGDHRSDLHYYKESSIDLTENHELVSVDKVNENWFVVVRDWN